MSTDWDRLHNLIQQRFSLAGVKELGFYLDLDYDELRGEVKSEKIWSLLACLADLKRGPELLDVLRQERPSTPWPDLDLTAPFPKRQAQITVPLQFLPQAIAFTGREAEIDWLAAALQPDRIVTLVGPGGVGKTAVAAETLLRLADAGDLDARFPDGVVTYSFYGQGETTLCLAHLARSFLGEEAQDLSADAARRALAGKQALLVLDGAEQAVDLGAVLRLRGRCGVLLTTRDRQQAPEPRWRLEIGTLAVETAAALLCSLVGETAVDGGEALAAQVDGLPLAVQIIGGYLAATGRSVAGYRRWLAEQPLAALSHGEHRAQSMGVLLDRSLAQVSDDARLLMAAVGWLAARAFPAEQVAGMLGMAAEAGRRACDELVRFSLLRHDRDWQAVSHALIHAHARGRLALMEAQAAALAKGIGSEVHALNEAGYPIPLLPWLPHCSARPTDWLRVKRRKRPPGFAVNLDLRCTRWPTTRVRGRTTSGRWR
ncbi:MAG: hypothetical protein KC425_18210 [Anaerolineales bacterium]|nr:hypothetical protein [Anaerolineales bacterium]